jgi:hypothetical protein
MTTSYTNPPLLQLFRLTIQLRDARTNAYSMGSNATDAYERYVARALHRKENIAGLEFVEGELANPHGASHRSMVEHR